MAQENDKELDYLQDDLDMSNPEKIAGPDFMDELRAAMRRKVQISMERNERQNQNINRLFHLIHPQIAAHELPTAFTEGLENCVPLDEIIIGSILEEVRVYDAKGYGTIIQGEQLKAYFTESEDRKRKLTFMREKRAELGLGIDENTDSFYEQLMQLDTPEELYRLLLVLKIKGENFKMAPGELQDLYKDTEALVWLAEHSAEIREAEGVSQMSTYDYYRFLAKNKDSEVRAKLIPTIRKFKTLEAHLPEVKDSFSNGLSLGESYLDAVLELNPEQIDASIELLNKIKSQTEGNKRTYPISEFFLLCKFMHDNPIVFSKENWRVGEISDQIHPTRLIHQEVFHEGLYNSIGNHKYILNCGSPIFEWSNEIHGYSNLGRFHYLKAENFFTEMQDFVDRLAPLNNEELRTLVKKHFELDFHELGELFEDKESWESPQFRKKLKILVQYRLEAGEKIKEIDIVLAKNEKLDAEALKWIIRLRNDEKIKFNILDWMESYSLSYVKQKVSRLKKWHNDPIAFRAARDAGLFSPDFDHRKHEYSSYFCNYTGVTEYGGAKKFVADIKKVRTNFPNFRYNFCSEEPEPYFQILNDAHIQDTERIKVNIEPFIHEIMGQSKENPEKAIKILMKALSRDALNRDYREEVKEMMENDARINSLNDQLKQDLYYIFVELHLIFGDTNSLQQTINELDFNEDAKRTLLLNIIHTTLAQKPEAIAQIYHPIVKEYSESMNKLEDVQFVIRLLLILSNLRALSGSHLELVQEIINQHQTELEEKSPQLVHQLNSLYIEASIVACDSSQGWDRLFNSLRALDIDLKERQILFARIMESAIANDDLNAINDLCPDSEILAGDYMSEFIDKYHLGSKGKTIVVLAATNEYRDAENMSELIQNTLSALESYEVVLNHYDSREVPNEIQASIGMEYEITQSIAQGYAQRTEGRDLKTDINRLSRYSGTGSGADAVHEIATQPTDNPAALLLEMYLYQELDYIDFNFNGAEYGRGARGYHLSVGGAHGISIGWGVNLLQNALIMANWGGINSGKDIHTLSKGRGTNIRQRYATSANNVALFDKATPTVEMRCLSIDKKEPFERAILASHDGAIAIQAVDKFTNITPEDLQTWQSRFPQTQTEFEAELRTRNLIKTEPEDPQTMSIIYAWCRMSTRIMNSINDHNENFLSNETHGYPQGEFDWIEVDEFGGEDNKNRFRSVTAKLGQDLDDYVETTKVPTTSIFEPATPALSNAMTHVNNLYLKPSTHFGGDMANAMAMLSVTKLDNTRLEESDGKVVEKSIFDRNGKQREGYYTLQGGSERMIIHGIQKAILDFQKEMDEILSDSGRIAA